MDKIKEIMKWIGIDGLLHVITCFACMLAFTPIVGVWWAIGITTAVAIGKEAIDAIKGADIKAINHDFVCDAVGLILAVCTIGLWWIFNLN